MSSVAIVKTAPCYPPPPFSPGAAPPEYPFSDTLPAGNGVYEAVRSALYFLGFDKRNYGTPRWNPLGALIRPGDCVLVKPNLVNSAHRTEGDLWAVVTHAAMVRAVIDYVVIALAGKGQIVIADSPERMADFDAVVRKTGLGKLLEYYHGHGVPVELCDLRREQICYGMEGIVERRKLKGDPRGYRRCDLGAASAFCDLPPRHLVRLYGADYNRSETVWHHAEGRHIYELANTLLGSNVVITIPKLKTHKKAGVTLSLKGFIGCAGNKNLIPHRTVGDPQTGGDSYRRPAVSRRGRFYRQVADLLKDHLLGAFENRATALAYCAVLLGLRGILSPPREDIIPEGGAWPGNDTLWRSILDVARAAVYADRSGCLSDRPQRRFLAVVDGIYAGEGEGPMAPKAKKAGIILAGSDLLAVDVACTHLMGFDYRRVPYLRHAFQPHRCDLAREARQFSISSNVAKFSELFSLRRKETLCCEAPLLWKGTLELRDSGSENLPICAHAEEPQAGLCLTER